MDLLKRFPMGKLHSVELPGGHITTTGVHAISTFIWSACDKWPVEVKKLSVFKSKFYEGSDAFEWEWCTSKGTLPRRVSKLAKQICNHNVDVEFLEKLGTLAKQHTNNHEAVLFDITSAIQWEPGDFGDDGSCLWAEERSAALTMIEKNGYAIRLFHANQGNGDYVRGHYHGMGRCWLAPWRNHDTDESIAQDRFILFNGYGGHRDSLWFARTFATIMSYHYRKIGLSCNGREDEPLYINNCIGYAISAERVSISEYDLHWDRNVPGRHASDDEFPYFCEACQTGLQADDALHSQNGTIYCTGCGVTCCECSDVFLRAEANRITTDGGARRSVCPDCWENSPLCAHCDEPLLSAVHTIQELDGSYYHRVCREQVLTDRGVACVTAT